MTGTENAASPRAFAEAAQTVLARTVELCAVPAPPLDEGDRASLVHAWWRADGLAELGVDATGNVWARVRAGDGSGSGDALVVAAHLDTVFARSVRHGVRRDGDRLVGPGVGDDSVAVASLSALDRLLPPASRHPVWVLATVGEEGLGNLRGITEALASPGLPVGAVIAVEGNYLGRVTTVGVGSVRWRIVLTGPGGHAWEDADAPSAVHTAARLVTELDALPRPAGARCSVNVGLISGGESINSRAITCAFQLDLRSDEPAALIALTGAAEDVLARVPRPLSVRVERIGARPAGRIATEHPLVRAASQALDAVGRPAHLTAASTDANAAYARGLPAITVGITTGDATHTEQEWIEVPPIPDGLAALVHTIASYDNEEW